MQDNAPGYAAKSTQASLADRNIAPIAWPARSTDLNPIEHCWAWMKSYVEEMYGDKKLSSIELRQVLLETWENSVTAEKLDSFLIHKEAIPDIRKGFPLLLGTTVGTYMSIAHTRMWL